MIECNSYIFENKKAYLIGNKKHLFINIEDYQNNEEEIRKILSSNYINGFIDLKINGQQVFGEKYWDDLDCLWSYFVDTLSTMILKNEVKASFSFPDQPITVDIERYNSLIELKLDTKKWIYNEHDFIYVCLSSAKKFFEIYNRYNNKYGFTDKLNLIEKTLKHI